MPQNNKSYNSTKLVLTVLILLLSLVSMTAYAQPGPPSVRCISVESNGNVTLSWIAPIDTGTSFGGYHIYFSNLLTGPYIPIDSVFNYSVQTTTITGVNANNTILYFYIKTREGCCNNYSVSSDTLKSMRMIVTPFSNEHVRLNWNRIHTPPLPTTFTNFAVSKELTPGVYSVFRNTTDTTTLDTNYFCNKFINYRVTQGDLSGCTSASSLDGEIFRDTKGPAQTLIDTVSIDLSTGNVTVSWFPDSSADTQGYVIYQFNGISYDSIGTVSGINSLSYINTVTNSDTQIETYSVAAYDSCRNLSQLAVNHKTMLLTTNFVKCQALVTLNWSPYINMRGGLARYEIWIRENSGAWFRDGFVPATVTSYSYTLINSGSVYDFYIRAISTSGPTATSNLKSVVADILTQPAYLYIRSASVSGSAVQVKCYVDPSGDIASYVLYRGNSATGTFTPVATKNFTPSSDIVFDDPFAAADLQSRFYKLTARDSCGLELVSSNITGTVHLSAEGGNDYSSQLSWTTYTGWENSPGSWHLFRVNNGIREAAPFAVVSGDTMVYSEDVSDLAFTGGNICYTVMASEDSVNSFGFSDSAFSNVACAPQEPYAYIPNAFTPEGSNPVFLPYLLFEDPASYNLRIFNRWGQTVFFSDVPAIGWNGTFNNTDAPTGIYAYLLVFKGLNKKEIRMSGTITLIR